MKTKLLFLVTIVALLVAACAPAAVPTPQVIEKTVEVTKQSTSGSDEGRREAGRRNAHPRPEPGSRDSRALSRTPKSPSGPSISRRPSIDYIKNTIARFEASLSRRQGQLGRPSGDLPG